MTREAFCLIAAGIGAALHVGKLPPALRALQEALGLGLVESGFLLSAIQLSGMLAGVALGALADGFGHRRSLIGGLLLLAAASGAGALASGAAMLMALRALEGAAFLLVVLSAPSLLREHVPAGELPRALGLWGAYMPIATASAFLAGPLVVAALGWHAWWLGLALLNLAAAWAVHRWVPARHPPLESPAEPAAGDAACSPPAPEDRVGAWWARLRLTLTHQAPWFLALTFFCYSAQWLAVVGFLPMLYAAAGWSPLQVAVVSACVAAANAGGNILAGRLLQRGVAATTLLRTGCLTMAAMALIAYGDGLGALFGTVAGGAGARPDVLLRVAATTLFSMVGGLVPATLFALAVRLAPRPQALSTTLGWLQQLSASGQFCGPPLVAFVASRAGGWQFTGWVTAGLAALALLLTLRLAALDARSRGSPVRA